MCNLQKRKAGCIGAVNKSVNQKLECKQFILQTQTHLSDCPPRVLDTFTATFIQRTSQRLFICPIYSHCSLHSVHICHIYVQMASRSHQRGGHRDRAKVTAP